MKHCYLCRWSFTTTVHSEGEDPALTPVIKCWPNGDRDKEQIARSICRFYDPEDYVKDLTGRKDEQ